MKRNRLSQAIARSIANGDRLGNTTTEQLIADTRQLVGRGTLQIIGRQPMIFENCSYWPKRRNQHSKPYNVISITEDGVVHFSRTGWTNSETLTIAEFADVAGRLLTHEEAARNG